MTFQKWKKTDHFNSLAIDCDVHINQYIVQWITENTCMLNKNRFESIQINLHSLKQV